MSEELKKTEDALQKLVQILRDGHQGFIELEKNLKDPEARKLFREETLVRAGFAAELENELHHFGVKDVKTPGSTTAGKVHRAWGELKARLGGGDHALLVTAEQGEDEARDTYDEVLASEDFPLPLREILLRQQRHILAVHDQVKVLRDRLAP
ncbi:MAG TPA: PA2169 family four-helix-bundle protein [Acidobacteriaceae bacterium]|nr:PA2169 family four-helix-bundle protein [Acidobacteriaceae bacterium]